MDAFRYDYIHKGFTPFLSTLAKKHRFFAEVKPGAGFCERSEIFTGSSPLSTNNLLALGYKPTKHNFRKVLIVKSLSFVERIILFDNLNNRGRLWRRFRYVVYLLNRRLNFLPDYGSYLIPLRQLLDFGLTEDDKECGISIAGNSIFSFMRSKGYDVNLESFTALGVPDKYTSDKERLLAAEKNLSNIEKGFVPVYLSMPDAMGHKFGPNPEEFSKDLLIFDKDLKEFYDKVIRHQKPTRFLFLGDHGMTNVTIQFDVYKSFTSLVKKSGLKEWRDYELFLDSTVLRIWLKSKKAHEWKFQYDFNSCILLKHGRWISSSLAKKHKIPMFDRSYGDLIWWADSGVLIFPNYFNAKAPRGMHGYLPGSVSNRGLLIDVQDSLAKQEEKAIHLTDIYQMIKENI